ncbi:MAG TPA: hypothetical protein VNX68_02840 [Nitrosopumilaceae archaeon]|jgi:hypothetical protein|nr:hypothetical protein [Nitrosopumilaceae archaeon]
MTTLATITIIIIASLVTIAAGVRKNRRSNKQAPCKYNNFHLGEMTKYDVPRKEEYVAWSQKQAKKESLEVPNKKRDQKWKKT